MDFSWTGNLLGAVAMVVVIAAIFLSGRVQSGSRTAREGVATPPASAPIAVSEILDRLAIVESDNKKIRREWEDQTTTFDRRWGALTRQMRRDGARDREEEAAPDHESHDQAQLDLLAAEARNGVPEAHQGRLVAARRLKRA